MPWIHILEASVIGGIVTSLTDWLFAGDWLKAFYNKHPEVWRFVAGKGEGVAIACASPRPCLPWAIFARVYAKLGLHTTSSALKLAMALWVMIPVPLLVTNALFIKLHWV